MSKKQTLPENFFENGERLNDETAEDSKTANKKKAAFKRKYQESYLNYGFIETGDSFSKPTLYNMWLSKEAMKTSKLLCHMETKHSALKDKSLEFFKRKNVNTNNRSNYRRPLHQMCLH